MVAIIDYDAGNIRSVQKAFEFLGADTCITRNRDEIMRADHVVLPGVGSFGDAMEKLEKYELVDVIKDVIKKGTPFLGICLGLQLLFEESEESPGVSGLGVLKGKIHMIPDNTSLKVPHVGWNSLDIKEGARLFRGISNNAYVYFVHSYYLAAEEDIVTATSDYVVNIHASVQKNNIYACQFHPEKSGDVGLTILKNFMEA